MENDIKFSMGREEIIGCPSHYQVSDLGVAQFRNDYDPELLQSIAEKALSIKVAAAEKRHLNLNYIRAAHTHIPEIMELVSLDSRLDRLSSLAGVRLENYPHVHHLFDHHLRRCRPRGRNHRLACGWHSGHRACSFGDFRRHGRR